MAHFHMTKLVDLFFITSLQWLDVSLIIINKLKALELPQTALLRYVLEQPYSRDTVCIMLNLNKQVCYVL